MFRERGPSSGAKSIEVFAEHDYNKEQMNGKKRGDAPSDVLPAISPGTAGSYRRFFQLLCNIELSETAAEDLHDRIARYWKNLGALLGRAVDFRVAALDYFLREESYLEDPRLIEKNLYDSQVKMALVDDLTGLYNRRFLYDHLTKEVNRSRRYGLSFSVIFADIDNFKQVNDDHGHHVGDDVLRDLGAVITHHLRSEDIAARYGGEEFVIAMPQTGLSGARILAQRLLSAVRSTQLGGLNVTFSGGVAAFPDHGDDVDSILAKADAGLYNSKLQGKNQITITPVDKRRSMRFSVEMPVEIHLPDATGSAKSCDMSPKGIAFEAGTKLDVGRTVRLSLADREGQVYELTSQIVWIRRIEDSGKFKHGAKYASDRLPYATIKGLSPAARPV